MYKCLECGHLFEPGGERRWREDYGERVSGCPVCRGPYMEAERCWVCGGCHFPDELYCGVCELCLIARMDPERVGAFLKDAELLEDYAGWLTKNKEERHDC